VEMPRVRVWPSLLAAWLASGLYVVRFLPRGWVPHDEGALAQSAERVLQGQLPHADFAEIYTGGLSYLHALAFQVLGMTLLAPRLTLFLFFLAWVPALFYCLSRFLPPVAAAVATLVAVTWSLPNYFAAMPSWYNLFFATFGMAALLRYAESPNRGWLFLAGVAGGVSLTIKIAGLYYVAAALLYLALREADNASRTIATGRPTAGYGLLIGLPLAVFVGALVWLVHGGHGLGYLYQFVLPGCAVAGVVARAAWRSGGATGSRTARLWQLVWPFGAGVALPVALFLVPYVVAGATGALLRGVFVSPMSRLAFAAKPPARWVTMIPAAVGLALFTSAAPPSHSPRWLLVFGSGAAAAGAVLALGDHRPAYKAAWYSLAQATPLIVAAVAVLLIRREGTIGQQAGEQALIAVAVAGLFNLIQFPYAAPIYFCYSAPLAIVAGAGLLRLRGGVRQPITVLLAAFYLGFGLLWVNRGRPVTQGSRFFRDASEVRLALPRGGLRIDEPTQLAYTRIVSLLQGHAKGGFTYAAPDCPEIYFLSGLGNPTRALFDFIEPRERGVDRVLPAIIRAGVTAVVINRKPKFSDRLPEDLDAELTARFPQSEEVGRFTVRWAP
jgi:hypothetical protein